MKQLTFPLLVMLTVCLATATAFVVRQPLSSDSSDSKTEVISTTAAQESSERGPVRMIRFVLSDDGIYPHQMRVDHGLLNIALEDRTGKTDGLVIESVQGDQRVKVTQISRVEKHWRGRALVRLVPGQYLVSDASQPSHTAELIVNP